MTPPLYMTSSMNSSDLKYSGLHLQEDRRRHYYITVIIAVGFLLRWHGLTGQSIWLDEAFSIYNSQQSLFYILGQKGNTPPLYYLLLHFWILIMGNSESGTRLLSLIPGTITIFVIYKLGSLIFNIRTGLCAALMLAISPLHIYFSQEARPYSLLLLLASLSMYFYLKLKDNPSKGAAAGYLAASIFLIYSHLYGLLILVVQNIDHLIRHKAKAGKSGPWVLLQLIIVIFYIPWIIRLPEIIAVQSHSWIPRPNLLSLIPVFYKYVAGEVFSFYGLIAVLIYISLIIKYPFKSKKNESLFLLSWLLVPIVLPFAFSVFFTPVFTIRYTLAASLALFLIAAYSLNNTDVFKRSLLLTLIVIFSSLALYVQQSTTIKDAWRETSDFIQSNIAEGDQVILINSYEVFPFSYYFDPDCFKSTDIYKCSNLKSVFPADSIEDVRRIKAERVWLVLSKDQYIDDIQDILDLIYEEYMVVNSREYLTNQNSAFFNRLHHSLTEKGLMRGRYNKIRIRYLVRKPIS